MSFAFSAFSNRKPDCQESTSKTSAAYLDRTPPQPITNKDATVVRGSDMMEEGGVHVSMSIDIDINANPISGCSRQLKLLSAFLTSSSGSSPPPSLTRPPSVCASTMLSCPHLSDRSSREREGKTCLVLFWPASCHPLIGPDPPPLPSP